MKRKTTISMENNSKGLKANLAKLLLLVLMIAFNQLALAQAQTFSTPGTYTFTVPAGVTSLTVSAWGGGGAGGGLVNGNGTARAGGGGEGGSFVRGTISVSPGSTYTVVVGSSGVASTGAGTAGGASSFGGSSFFNAIGGVGGNGATNGSRFGAGGSATNTGNVASGTTTSTNYGGNGGSATTASTASSGGGGGSAGSVSGGGNGGVVTGGTAGTGGGVVGATGRGSVNDGVGLVGGNPGAGGSGARDANNTSSYIGGEGGDGQVAVAWTCAGPNVSNFSMSAVACSGSNATVTVNSTSITTTGNYTVYYNLTGANVTASPQLATLNFNAATDIGTFSTIALANPGATTVTIVSIDCVVISTGNSANITINQSPTSVTATGSASSICTGGSVNLTSSATSNSAPTTPVTLLDENFNGAAIGWTKTAAGTGTRNDAWTLRANNYATSSETLSSNDASQFYLSDSDAQGSGSTTTTTLQSPTFSTVGLSAASLSFYHYYRYNGTESANVDISTDGTNWTLGSLTYTSTQGARNGFVLATLNLSSVLNQATVYVRFRYASSWDWYWAIDNVSVTGISSTPAPATFAWTSSPSGFTSSIQNPTGVSPTVSTTYTVTATNNYGCSTSATTSTVTVNPLNTIASGINRTTCISSAITNITLATTGATGATFSGLPAGVSGSWSGNVVTISGTPTASGTFNYTVTTTGGCPPATTTGTITVTPLNTIAAGINVTNCFNSAITTITLATTGATGATFSGLPAGVSGSWSGNVVTISGTPTASGTFNYTVTTTGGCPPATTTGTITVTPLNTIASGINRTTCISSAITNITLATTGATGATFSGLPAGVSGSWSANVVTISGTPTASGTFNYTVTTTGGCPPATTTGTITVTPLNTIAAGINRTTCINSAITNISLATTGATGATVTGLPTGVTGSWAANVVTISGTPTVSGSFTYSVTTTGGCPPATTTGTITVNGSSTTAIISGSAAICSGSSTNLQIAITGGLSPYTVVYTTGSVSSYTSGSNIPVSPSSTTAYTLTTVTDANGCLGTGNSGAATVTLTSTSSSDGVSWTNGTPNGTKDAILTGASPIVLGADLNACSLTVNGPAVSVTSGFDVTLNGAMTVSSGSFTLDNNANLIQNNSNYTNSGNIIVKRNSSALKRLDYTIWSTPVTGQGLYAFSPFTFGNRFYVYRTNTNLFNSPDVGFNITGLNPDGVNGTDSNNVQFSQAKGYLIRVPWNHPTAPAIWNGSFTGVPNNGDITYTLTNGGAGNRFNLVGNPYPSPIDAVAFVTNTNNNNMTTGTLYFWRKTNNALSPSYCTWTLGGFVTNGEAQVFDPNDVIQTGQGFFVEGTGSGTVNFDNTMRINNHANQFFRTTAATTTNTTLERNRIWLNATNATGLFSQAMVGYITNATQGVDAAIDGKYINDGDIALTSLINDVPYAIQGRALPFDTADVVPMNFKVTTAGNYTIAIDHVDGLFTDGTQLVYLKDNLTATIHNLSGGAYTFTSDAGTFNNRFELVYQTQLANPVFTVNTVVIYSHNTAFVVNSGNFTMSSIKVFDIRGRLIEEKTGINANETTIKGGLANQVLLVQITSEDGVVVTKKVIR